MAGTRNECSERSSRRHGYVPSGPSKPKDQRLGRLVRLKDQAQATVRWLPSSRFLSDFRQQRKYHSSDHDITRKSLRHCIRKVEREETALGTAWPSDYPHRGLARYHIAFGMTAVAALHHRGRRLPELKSFCFRSYELPIRDNAVPVPLA